MAFHKIKDADIWYTPKDRPREIREQMSISVLEYGKRKMKALFKAGCQEIVMYVRYGEDDPRNFQLSVDEKGIIRRHNNC